MRLKTLVSLLLTALAGVNLSIAQQSGGSPTASRSLQGRANYGRLPLTFEANRGQSSGQVKFVSRGKGYTAFLTSGGMVLNLRPAPVANKAASTQPSAASTTLQFQLLGGNHNPVAVGEEQQPGKVNYFLGNDPAKWHTNVPTYGRVRYKSVYPGIDLVFYGNHQQLEYDFAVAPGGDPRHIQFEIQGANQISVDGEGNLVLGTGVGQLHFQSPVVYQESNGQRVPVEGGYVMQDATHIGFQVAHYDASQPLVIDPVLLYSTYLGGSSDDQPTGIAVDSTGSVYIAGYTDSADFPLATLGSLAGGANHVFVAKLDPTGSQLIYADYLGGNSQDYGIALALDSANNVYVTGSTASSNFPAVKAYQAQQPGPYSGFASKISASGSSLVYSTYLGGNGFDEPASVAVDSLGQLHVAGSTTSQNFPVANAYQSSALANQGGVYGTYGFLTKFSSDGSSLVYSTYVAGNTDVAQDCGSPCWPAPYNVVSAVAVDANGNAYLTGTTNANNFPTSSGAYLATNSTQQDASIGFVSKFTSVGGLGYSTYLYGSSGDPVEISAIAVDGSGSAYVTGTADSDGTFPITSTSICDPGADGFGCSYAFVTKFDAAASTLLYSTFLGANNYATPEAIAVDGAGNAYVAASTASSAFQTVNSIEPYSNKRDTLLVEIDPAATTQVFATYLGGSGNDSPSGIALDSNGNIYVAGSTTSPDFPTSQSAEQSVLGGGTDGFVVKIGAASASSVALSPSALQYTALAVGSTSQSQTVVLRNLGSAALTISSITASGDFAQTNTCGNSVPAASSCTLSVTFTPTAAGSRTGAIVIQDDAQPSAQSVNLTGIGTAAGVSLTPAGLTFTATTVGLSSASQAVTLRNTGNAALSISSIQVSGDFGQTNNCPATLSAGSTCTITVAFTPTATGTRTGTLSVNDSVQGGTQTVSLTGTASDFSVTSSTSSNTIKAGATATYTLAVSSVGGSFASAVSLNCSGLPANATCSFSPATVTPGVSGGSATMTITTASSSADATPASSSQRPVLGIWMQMQGLGLFGVVLAGCKRSKRATIFVLLALLVLGMMFMSGCAGGTGIAQTKTGTSTSYTVTITGTSGALQHSAPVTLTVTN